MEPFEVELVFCQEFFPVVSRRKKKKNSLSDDSHDVTKSFSANKSYHFFFYIKDLKPVAVAYAFV